MFRVDSGPLLRPRVAFSTLVSIFLVLVLAALATVSDATPASFAAPSAPGGSARADEVRAQLRRLVSGALGSSRSVPVEGHSSSRPSFDVEPVLLHAPATAAGESDSEATVVAGVAETLARLDPLLSYLAPRLSSALDSDPSFSKTGASTEDDDEADDDTALPGPSSALLPPLLSTLWSSARALAGHSVAGAAALLHSRSHPRVQGGAGSADGGAAASAAAVRAAETRLRAWLAGGANASAADAASGSSDANALADLVTVLSAVPADAQPPQAESFPDNDQGADDLDLDDGTPVWPPVVRPPAPMPEWVHCVFTPRTSPRALKAAAARAEAETARQDEEAFKTTSAESAAAFIAAAAKVKPAAPAASASPSSSSSQPLAGGGSNRFLGGAAAETEAEVESNGPFAHVALARLKPRALVMLPPAEAAAAVRRTLASSTSAAEYNDEDDEDEEGDYDDFELKADAVADAEAEAMALTSKTSPKSAKESLRKRDEAADHTFAVLDALVAADAAEFNDDGDDSSFATTAADKKADEKNKDKAAGKVNEFDYVEHPPAVSVAQLAGVEALVSKVSCSAGFLANATRVQWLLNGNPVKEATARRRLDVPERLPKYLQGETTSTGEVLPACTQVSFFANETWLKEQYLPTVLTPQQIKELDGAPRSKVMTAVCRQIDKRAGSATTVTATNRAQNLGVSDKEMCKRWRTCAVHLNVGMVISRKQVCLCPYDSYGFFCERPVTTECNVTLVSPSVEEMGCDEASSDTRPTVDPSSNWPASFRNTYNPNLFGVRPCLAFTPEGNPKTPQAPGVDEASVLTVTASPDCKLRAELHADLGGSLRQGLAKHVINFFALKHYTWPTDYGFVYYAFRPADDSPGASEESRDELDALPPLFAMSAGRDPKTGEPDPFKPRTVFSLSLRPVDMNRISNTALAASQPLSALALSSLEPVSAPPVALDLRAVHARGGGFTAGGRVFVSVGVSGGDVGEVRSNSVPLLFEDMSYTPGGSRKKKVANALWIIVGSLVGAAVLAIIIVRYCLRKREDKFFAESRAKAAEEEARKLAAADAAAAAAALRVANLDAPVVARA